MSYREPTSSPLPSEPFESPFEEEEDTFKKADREKAQIIALEAKIKFLERKVATLSSEEKMEMELDRALRKRQIREEEFKKQSEAESTKFVLQFCGILCLGFLIMGVISYLLGI